MSGNTDLLERVITLHNTVGPEKFADVYAADAVVVTPEGTYEGRAAIRDYWRWVSVSFPCCRVTLGKVIEQGDTIAFEYTWAGTNSGPLTLPDGTELPPTGRRVEVRCIDLGQVRDGKLIVHHLYWDNLDFEAQLGVLPGTATTSRRRVS